VYSDFRLLNVEPLQKIAEPFNEGQTAGKTEDADSPEKGDGIFPPQSVSPTKKQWKGTIGSDGESCNPLLLQRHEHVD
jgi:hypothetical protein